MCQKFQKVYLETPIFKYENVKIPSLITSEISNKNLSTVHPTLFLNFVIAPRIVDHLEKCGLFPDFQYAFRSSRSTADLLIVVSDRIARAFK